MRNSNAFKRRSGAADPFAYNARGRYRGHAGQVATTFRVASGIGLSFGAQNLGRVCAQRAKHGGESGEECREQKHTRRQSDHVRVSRFDLEEKRRDITCCAESEAKTRATSEGDHQENIDSDKVDDASTRRANRHADPDFPAALEYRVVKDGVESDAGKEQCDGGKEGGEHGNQSLANGLVADQLELKSVGLGHT